MTSELSRGYNHQYYEKNKEKLLAQQKQYRAKHLRRIAECDREYRQRHKDELRLAHRAYYQKHKKHMNERMKAYRRRPEIKEHQKAYFKAYNQEHREYIRERCAKHIQKPMVKERLKNYKRDYYQKNKEGLKKRMKEYRQRPEVKKRTRERNKKKWEIEKRGKKTKYRKHIGIREYMQAHPGLIDDKRAYNKAYNELYRKLDGFKERSNACSRVWRKTPRGKACDTAMHNKRRLKFPVELTANEIEQIKQRDVMKCVYCGQEVFEYPVVPKCNPQQMTLDHVNPNGGTTMDNMVVACHKCNASKGNKSVFEWCKEKGYRVPLVAMVVMRNGD